MKHLKIDRGIDTCFRCYYVRVDEADDEIYLSCRHKGAVKHLAEQVLREDKFIFHFCPLPEFEHVVEQPNQ